MILWNLHVLITQIRLHTGQTSFNGLLQHEWTGVGFCHHGIRQNNCWIMTTTKDCTDYIIYIYTCICIIILIYLFYIYVNQYANITEHMVWYIISSPSSLPSRPWPQRLPSCQVNLHIYLSWIFVQLYPVHKPSGRIQLWILHEMNFAYYFSR